MRMDAPHKLHWTQRIALVRHNLHAARQTNDFTFFKTLQAYTLINGMDHLSGLHKILGPDADSVLSALDNLNAGIAYVHQDAFKAVYDGAKSAMYKADNSPISRRSLLRVDIYQQRDMADHAIDKTANSAIQLIQSQPIHLQDAIANAWITGTTIIADAVCVCLNQMDEMEKNMEDFIRLEYSWNCIQNSVDAAISALRGIFSLMERSAMEGNAHTSRALSVSSATTGSEGGSSRSRTSSTASAFGRIRRAFSHGHMHPPPTPKSSRAASLPVPDANMRGLRASVSAACPTKMSNFSEHPHTLLTTIPPTPSTHEPSLHDAPLPPFKEKDDYFAFDREKAPEEQTTQDQSPSLGDLMQLDSFDPLYSPPERLIKMPVPLTFRRLSETFGIAPSAAIAV